MPAAVPATPQLFTCQPGRDGVPDSLPGRVLCGQYGIHTDHLWQVLTGHAPLLITVLAFNLLGDGFSDALNPRSRR